MPGTHTLRLPGVTWEQRLGEAVTALCLALPGHGAAFHLPWLKSFLFSALVSKTVVACALPLPDIPGR